MNSDLTCKNCGPSFPNGQGNRPIYPVVSARGPQFMGGMGGNAGFGMGGAYPGQFGNLQGGFPINAGPQQFVPPHILHQQQQLQQGSNGAFMNPNFSGPLPNNSNFGHPGMNRQVQNMQGRAQVQPNGFNDPHYYGPNNAPSDVYFGNSSDSAFGQYKGQGNILPPNLRKISGSSRLDNMMNRTHKIVEQYRNSREQRDALYESQVSPQNAVYGSVSMFDPNSASYNKASF